MMACYLFATALPCSTSQEKQEEENRRTAAAERRIRELEKVERDMIDRLKKTQTLQQKVRRKSEGERSSS